MSCNALRFRLFGAFFFLLFFFSPNALAVSTARVTNTSLESLGKGMHAKMDGVLKLLARLNVYQDKCLEYFLYMEFQTLLDICRKIIHKSFISFIYMICRF